MNYRHIYHAGNAADVFKHCILIALIQSLQKKEAGFCYLDTHAGCGLYQLTDPLAEKTAEYQSGIEKLFSQQDFFLKHPIFTTYLQCIQKINPQQKKLDYYPGSPVIAQALLRPQDRAIFSELHPDDYTQLKKIYYARKEVAVHHQNGWQGLKAFLPPKERRGLILIDPPYEIPNELEKGVCELKKALTRFANGVYALWYPIKLHLPRNYFYHQIKETINQPALCVELTILPEKGNNKLAGSGMIIINPPWQLAETLQCILPPLWQIMSEQQQGKWHVTCITKK